MADLNLQLSSASQQIAPIQQSSELMLRILHITIVAQALSAALLPPPAAATQ